MVAGYEVFFCLWALKSKYKSAAMCAELETPSTHAKGVPRSLKIDKTDVEPGVSYLYSHTRPTK